MENKYNNLQLNPNKCYWEAVFLSFLGLQEFTDYFHDIKSDEDSFLNLFKNFFNKNISIKQCVEEFIKIVKLKNKENLLEKPINLFDFLLDELDNELNKINYEKSKEKEENNESDDKDENNESNENSSNDNNKEEYNNNKDNKIYNEEKNKSFINNELFGEIEKTKKCQICKTEFKEKKLFKFLPINIKYITGDVELQYLYKNIQREHEKPLFCEKCNKQQNFNIKVTIQKEPENFIIVFYNHNNDVSIDFSEEIFKNKYCLKSLVIRKKNSSILDNLLCCKKKNKVFISYGISNNENENKKYFILSNDKEYNSIDKKDIFENIPYILFYQRKKKEIKEIEENNTIELKNNLDSNESFLLKNKNKKKNNYINNNSSKNDDIEIKKIVKIPTLKNSKIFSSQIKNDNKEKKFKINNLSKSNKNFFNNKLSNENSKEIMLKNNDESKNNNSSNTNLNNTDKKNLIELNNNDNNLININNDNNNIEMLKNNLNINNEINATKNNINIDKSINKNIEKSLISNNKSIIYDSNNTNYYEEQNIITIYFKFSDGNIFFIDIDDRMSFKNIINKLKNRYEWITLDNQYLYFNERKIEINDIPRDIGIEDGSYIDVTPNLIDENNE